MTLVALQRQPHFTNLTDVELIRDLLMSTADRHWFRVWAYCFMPDHLHLLLQGNGPGASVPKFVRDFKQRSAYAFRQRHGVPLWQRSYYDHVFRKDADILSAARYIFENPVRKGMIEKFTAYRFSGPPETLERFG